MALVLAPLAHGSTRPAGAWLLVALLGAAAGCWLVSWWPARRVPLLPTPVWIGLGLLLLSLAPWFTGLAQPTSAAAFTSAHLARLVARWPASVTAPDPALALALGAGAGLALALAADLARDRRWRIAFATLVVLTATAVTLLALMQNLTQAPGIYWRNEGPMPGRFWGTFFHHTSAGAYLNTAWPLAAGLVFACWRLPDLAPFRTSAVLALVLLLGAHTSHVARFAPLAAAGVGAILVVRFGLLRSARRRLWLAGVLAGILFLALGTGRFGEIASRWLLVIPATPAATRPVPTEQEWPALMRADLFVAPVYRTGPLGDRGEAQATALRAFAARPLAGHGPGNWAAAASRHSVDPFERTFFLHLQYAHDDFLQTAAERGLPGLLAFLVLMPGAVLAAFRARRAGDPVAAALGFCAATGLAAVLVQALFDFPLQIPALVLNASVLAGLAWSPASAVSA